MNALVGKIARTGLVIAGRGAGNFRSMTGRE